MELRKISVTGAVNTAYPDTDEIAKIMTRGCHANNGAGRLVGAFSAKKTRRISMSNSVYKVIELVGTSTESWEKAALAAVERAGQSLRDLRVAEVVSQDLVVENGKVKAFRTKVSVSFKFED
jgi:flavin-binding protein dodecin